MEQSSKNWYDKSYKWMLIIPVALLLFSLVYMFNFYHQNGDIILKDVSLTGGTTVTVFDGHVKISDVKNALIGEFSDLNIRSISDIRTGQQEAFSIETKAEPSAIVTALEKHLGYKLNNDNSSVEFSGSSLSSGFYDQLKTAVLISFILMAIVVFVIFRTPIRSLSVILAGFADILMTITVLNIFHIPMSTAGIVALLMLIGYAVDVDILLTTRVVRDKEGNLNQRIWGAFKTGITMTLTAIAAMAVGLIFTHSFSAVLSQIFSIVLIGLGFDMINCWILNASILKWYMEATHRQ